jgi:hypothetical protein
MVAHVAPDPEQLKSSAWGDQKLQKKGQALFDSNLARTPLDGKSSWAFEAEQGDVHHLSIRPANERRHIVTLRL